MVDETMDFEPKSERAIASPLLVGLVIVAVLASSGAVYVIKNDDDSGMKTDQESSENTEDNVLKTGIEVGMRAPSFSLTGLDGERVSLENLRGEVVVLDFMAIWCPPCRVEMSHLREISQKYDNSYLTIISIDVDSSETKNELRNFAEEHNADWKFTISSNLGVKYRVRGIPTIYILNKEGVIQYKNAGLTSASKLESEIEAIL